MRNLIRLTASILILSGLAAGEALAQSESSPNTLRLDSPENMPAATIADIAWMAGHWRGEGLGGVCEEVWSPPAANAMMGMFRLIKDGQVVFYELMSLVEESNSLVLRIKHFTKDFIAWEDKEDFVRFPLVAFKPAEAYFSGLTMRQIDESSLKVFLVLKDGEGIRTEHEFHFRRVD